MKANTDTNKNNDKIVALEIKAQDGSNKDSPTTISTRPAVTVTIWSQGSSMIGFRRKSYI